MKLLPPFLFLLLASLNSALASLCSSAQYRAWTTAGAMGVAVLGVALLAWARLQFVKQDAEINTFETPRNLVVSGPFRMSRNPMYLGFLLILIALALGLDCPIGWISPAVFFALSTFWYIPLEEQRCEDAFGEEFASYRRRTRRWI